MSPVVASIGTKLGPGWSSFLKHATIDGEHVADLLADQVRFRITKAGATSIEHVIPDSARAIELWARPETRQFVQGVLDLAGEVRDCASPLRGFTLATSDAGFVANRAVHHFRAGVAPSRATFEAGIDASRAHIAGSSAVRKGNWLHLGPRRSEGLVHALEHPGTKREELSPRLRTSLGRGVKTILHELDHIGTPSAPDTANLDWLREARAEVFARWPGRVKHAGAKLGIDTPSGVGRWSDRGPGPYDDEVAALRALLRMQGIDPERASHLSRARQLLNHTPEDKLAWRIASRVAERHATDDTSKVELRSTVHRLINNDIAPDGSHAEPAAVRNLACELEASRRDRLAGGAGNDVMS